MKGFNRKDLGWDFESDGTWKTAKIDIGLTYCFLQHTILQ